MQFQSKLIHFVFFNLLFFPQRVNDAVVNLYIRHIDISCYVSSIPTHYMTSLQRVRAPILLKKVPLDGAQK